MPKPLRNLRWIVLIATLCFIFWRSQIGVDDYRRWLGANDDPSAQELYELSMWFEFGVVLTAASIGGVLFYVINLRVNLIMKNGQALAFIQVLPHDQKQLIATDNGLGRFHIRTWRWPARPFRD